jgi:hypothetical protein
METRTLLLGLLLLASNEALAHNGEHHEDHAHKAPHGGDVKTVGSGHLEALVRDGNLVVYVLDAGEKTVVPPKEAKASLLAGKAKAALALRSEADALVAPLPAGVTGKATVIVTVTLDGKPQSARFSLEIATAKASGPSGHSK